jgi:hypothetical protein
MVTKAMCFVMECWYFRERERERENERDFKGMFTGFSSGLHRGAELPEIIYSSSSVLI